MRSLSLNAGCYLLKINQPPSSTVKSCKTASDTGDCRRAFPAFIFCLKKVWPVRCETECEVTLQSRAYVWLAPWMRPACELTHRGGHVVKEVSGSRREEKGVMGREYGHSTLCTRMKLENQKPLKKEVAGNASVTFGTAGSLARLLPSLPLPNSWALAGTPFTELTVPEDAPVPRPTSAHVTSTAWCGVTPSLCSRDVC